MDVGVGSFLFASSLTSKQTLAVNSRLKTIQKTLSSTSPLLIVGFIRLLGVKATDYQEHVSEYGVHWNFFFTLASVSILFSLLQIVKHEINIVLGIFMLIAYQFSLSKFGLSSYLQNNDRSNLLNQNKEGIFSLFGYTALFLFGREIGRAIFSNKERDLANWKWMSVKMGLGSCITLLLGLLSHYYIEQTSRRMVNMAYVLTTLSMNLLLLSCLLLISICTPSTENVVLVSINHNGLAMFMLANLLTGAINLSIKTLYCGSLLSFSINLAYIFLLCGVAVVLYRKRILIKFW
eukprot:TRINITY_DN1142_c0_g1_i13.p1 TRINITY_DN1142_c0_g1~~TRINITY_DN1142_c0_g1_i13.p1  ORF type:complete len:292 (+),score=39.32 TRINITY_DN1142_c0_g1_i13:689-1564(+)